LRRFRRAYIEAAKGCGKSPLAAGLGMYFLAGKGICKDRGQTREQQRLETAARMCTASTWNGSD
jgi:phage terminase large subunit-like protein